MKYVVTENQLKVLLKEDRVTYLKNQYVIPKDQLKTIMADMQGRGGDRPDGGVKKGISIKPIEGDNGIDIAYIVTSKKGKESIKLSEEIFESIVDADPSSNNQFVQWMIGVFIRFVNEDNIDEAIRFLTEDLPEASEYLEVFENVRKKKVFKTGAPNRPNAPDNVTDINQYTSLSQLYSVVSPFIGMEDEDEEGVNPIWKKMKKYIDLGHAKLAYRDNDILVYVPETIESSCDPLGNLSSWCTRREGNSYFKSYRENNPKPDGSNSDLYVIMPKEIFEGGDYDDNFYPLQFHFETGQLHDKNNSSIEHSDGLKKVLNKYSGLKSWFQDKLGTLATGDIEKGAGLMDSRYLKYLNLFGGSAKDVISDEVYKKGVLSIRKLASEQTGQLQNNKYLKWLMENTEGVVITDYLDKDITVLDFSNMTMEELPDISQFKLATRISANNCGIVKLPLAKHLPKDTEVLTMTDNLITEVPGKTYKELQNCFVMNFSKNPIKKINIDVLDDLVTKDLARFVLIDVDLSNLKPKNLKEYETFKEDPRGIGYLVA